MAEGNRGELILPAPSWRGHLRKDAHRPRQIRRDVGRSIPRSDHRVLREIGDLIGGVSADRSCPCPRLRMECAPGPLEARKFTPRLWPAQIGAAFPAILVARVCSA